jgi:hypothetical protein
VRVWTRGVDERAWRPSVRVNDTRERDGTTQYRPAIGVAPDGRLDVAYYDRRADRRDVMNAVSMQSSTDGGRTFEPRIALSDRAFDSRVGFGSERGMADVGSRIGLLPGPARTMVVWADTRAGTQATGKQDIAAAVATFSTGERPIAARGPLRAGGVAAVVIGLALIVFALLARRRPDAGPRRDPDGRDDAPVPVEAKPPEDRVPSEW